jgi:hypothetical protein
MRFPGGGKTNDPSQNIAEILENVSGIFSDGTAA